SAAKPPCPKKPTAFQITEFSVDQELGKHFAGRVNQRKQREWSRDAFLSKVARTSRSHRRWFRLDEIEPDAAKRQELLGVWRKSIYSRDLDVKGRSQVLCLTGSPLQEGYRLPHDLARGEHFYAIANDLWMSAPRWLEFFRKVKKTPPDWLVEAVKKKSW